MNAFTQIWNLFTEISFPGAGEAYPSKLQADNENLHIKCLEPGQVSKNSTISDLHMYAGVTMVTSVCEVVCAYVYT